MFVKETEKNCLLAGILDVLVSPDVSRLPVGSLLPADSGDPGKNQKLKAEVH